MRGLSPRLKLRFLQLYPRFFFYGAMATFNTCSHRTFVFNFFWAILSFFFFPQTHFEPYHPLKSPITVHLLSHPPSLRSKAITLAIHLRSKTLASPSISDLNLRLTLHLWSKTLASPSISDLNLRLTLHLWSQPSLSISPISTLASPSIDDLTLTLTLHLLSHPHPPFPISTLASPSTSTTTTASRPISGFGFWDFPNQHSRVFLLSPCQFFWHSQRHHQTPWQTVSLFCFCGI